MEEINKTELKIVLNHALKELKGKVHAEEFDNFFNFINVIYNEKNKHITLRVGSDFQKERLQNKHIKTIRDTFDKYFDVRGVTFLVKRKYGK